MGRAFRLELSESNEVPALVETEAKRDAELPAPAFAALGSTRHILRMVAIVAAAFATLAGGTEALLWRGTHVRELLHLRPAVVPRIALEEIPSPAGAAEASPQISSDPAAARGSSQLLSIRSWSKPERTTVALFLKAPVRWESSMLRNPDRIYFDLENTRLPGELLAKSRAGLAIQVNDGLVNCVRVARRNTSAVRIVIDLAAAAQYTAVLSPTEPYRLMIVILGTQLPIHGAPKKTWGMKSVPRQNLPVHIEIPSCSAFTAWSAVEQRQLITAELQKEVWGLYRKRLCGIAYASRQTATPIQPKLSANL